ncbi:Piwi domain-containing protein [Caenorhabditis elegans]|nr:Piwi domain-containing protein [Caenorhabditis elegans]CCD71916.1 Piwi domain-containing protein [Caenorhabditis elegans]|eukprot:NP_871859.1 Piwi-like protein [Caenorhabditis elegans]
MEKQLKAMSVSDKPAAPAAQKLGTAPLAAKKTRNEEWGTKVNIDTNIRKLTIKPNQPIYKYAVQVNYVFRKPDGTEATIEMSKSAKKGTEHDNDKTRCQNVYNEAIKRYDELKTGGPFFYDRQASLYTLTKLKNESISFVVTDKICKRQNFKEAQFVLKKVDQSFQSTSNDVIKTTNSCPANADKTLLEAMNIIVSGPAFENKNVITVGACVHYLIDPTGVDVAYKEYPEGQLYSGVGVSKSVKTLEGTDKKVPSLFMTTEMKTTLFHPDYAPLVELLQTFRGFSTTLKANSPAAQRIEKAFVGLDVVLNYGVHKGLGEDGVVMKIRRFHTSAKETCFEVEKSTREFTNVFDYFKKKYGITLKYPDLFTIEAKGKQGKIHFPAEVLLLCPNQTVTNDQMINNEQADMIKMSAAQPHIRKTTTDTIVRNVGLASNNIYGFIKVEDPVNLEGMVLPKPKIAFAGNRLADLANPKSRFPTDFNRAGQYYDAKELTKWELVFVQNEEVQGLAKQLADEMVNNGMKCSNPTMSFIIRGDLEPIFKKAKAAGTQLLFFVVKSRYNYHQQIKALEQKYDVLTQEIRAETAEKVFRQPQTRLNIINKTNMKLGGLNYAIGSEAFNKPNRLIVGFVTSQRVGGNPDYPISVGFAANMLKHHQKFAGGYVYVHRDRDVFGSIIKDTLLTIFKTCTEQRGRPDDILLYFNGVSEGQFSMINEEFSARVKEACMAFQKEGTPPFRPHITIIASSKAHNERLYKSDKGRIVNLEPGTVVDHTIVSNVYTEWYHASAVARQGTAKATKFTLIFTTKAGPQAEPLWHLEQLTNDLCYDHQIVFHPVGLPVPLYIADRYSQRGAMVLAANQG